MSMVTKCLLINVTCIHTLQWHPNALSQCSSDTHVLHPTTTHSYCVLWCTALAKMLHVHCLVCSCTLAAHATWMGQPNAMTSNTERQLTIVISNFLSICVELVLLCERCRTHNMNDYVSASPSDGGMIEKYWISAIFIFPHSHHLWRMNLEQFLYSPQRNSKIIQSFK